MCKKELKALCDKASEQLSRCWVPTTLAVVISVAVSKLGMPIIALAGIGCGTYAYIKGYRVRLVKPTEDSDEAHY